MSPHDAITSERQARSGTAVGARRRVRASLPFLVLGIVLLVGAAFQAQSAVRSHRETVERVLHDYAAVAAWNYRQRLGLTQRSGELPSLLESIFHFPLHQRDTASATLGPDDLHRVPPSPSGLLGAHARPSDGDSATHIGPIRFAMRFTMAGGSDATAGPVPYGLPLSDVRALVRREVRGGRMLRRTEGAIAARLGGRPWLVLYSRQLTVGDTLLYALPLDSAAVAAYFERFLAGDALLPEPLVGDRTNGELVALQLRTRDGAVLFQSRPAPPARPAAAAEIPAQTIGLTVRVLLRDAASERLIIGGPPASRLPVLVALLAAAGALLLVGFGQLRREHALARLRGDFVASVSHELRTPLALQRVFLDMLLLGRARTDEQRRWSIENVDRESRRLAQLVENVLQFSRAEQRQLRLTLAPTALGPLLEEVAATFALLARPTGTTVALRLAPDVVVPADAGALRQVIMNVLENAAKYGPHGQTVAVTLVRAGAAAALLVDDEGPGVPVDERERVFEPFRRGAATVGGAVAGSGIGLSIVREIVRLHGGRVAIESAPMGGARVRIVLPGAHTAAGGARHAAHDRHVTLADAATEGVHG